MIKRLPEVLVFIFILIATFLAIRQHVVSGDMWLSIRQIWTHETLIIMFIFGAVCLIAGKYLGKIKR